jgi:microsomal dipeptidase-like Zn-dependent dipeptidase
LNLGGENILGFGADYDGIRDGTYESPQGYVDFLEILQKKIGLSDIQLEKISHINLKNMVKRVI